VSRLQTALAEIASHLQRERRGWALVGGLAVSAHAEPRFTRDIDLAVATNDDHDAEGLVRGLVASGYRVRASLEQEAVGRLATVRLDTPSEGSSAVVVDLLFASSGVEPEVIREAEVLEVLPGLRVPVAAIGHLLALKVLSVSPARPQDYIDILALLREARPADIDLARRTAALIVNRGFDRGRNLVADLEQHLVRT
jgi:predicted nucleotidyltransferase